MILNNYQNDISIDNKYSMKNSFKFWNQQKYLKENLNSKRENLDNKNLQMKLLRLNNLNQKYLKKFKETIFKKKIN